jgi:hypothetical protein
LIQKGRPQKTKWTIVCQTSYLTLNMKNIKFLLLLIVAASIFACQKTSDLGIEQQVLTQTNGLESDVVDRDLGCCEAQFVQWSTAPHNQCVFKYRPSAATNRLRVTTYSGSCKMSEEIINSGFYCKDGEKFLDYLVPITCSGDWYVELALEELAGFAEGGEDLWSTCSKALSAPKKFIVGDKKPCTCDE